MKQHERRQQTIQTLLQATKQLIEEKGCDLITLKDIMERSGLSKGAIFHYVKTKDEIYALVLLERLEEINQRFENQVREPKKEFEGPFREITKNMISLNEPKEITNQILIYLLSKTGRAEIDNSLKQFYDQSIFLSQQWIKAGKDHDVISENVDVEKMGELLVLISLGLRMRTFIPSDEQIFQTDDFIRFMKEILQNSIH